MTQTCRHQRVWYSLEENAFQCLDCEYVFPVAEAVQVGLIRAKFAPRKVDR